MPALPAREVDLTLHGAAFGGRMVARDEGRVVFVQGGIPGETVNGRLVAVRKSFAEGVGLAVVQSPDPVRVAPPCPYFGENGLRRGALPHGVEAPGRGAAGTMAEAGGAQGVCGGCQYQHIAYDAQLRYKRQIVVDLLRRVGHLEDVAVGDTVPAPSPWHYRTKARWSVDEQGQVSYRRADSRETVAVDNCLILAPALAAVMQRLATPAMAALLQGRVAEITARSARDADDPEQEHVTLLLHVRPAPPDENAPAAGGVDDILPAAGATPARPDEPGAADDPGARGLPLVQEIEVHPLADLAEALGEACGLRGVAVASDMPGGSARVLWGQGTVETMFAGRRFQLSAATFFQVNPAAAEALLAEVTTGLGSLRGQTLLDIYSGAGAFSLPLAGAAAEVFAVEYAASAVDDARASAALNGITNVHVLHGAAEVALREVAAGLVDVAILDPPRSGCERGVLDEVRRLELRRLVYVSCNPATLARDLALLREYGYRTESVRPVDLFPQTASIEAVATLARM